MYLVVSPVFKKHFKTEPKLNSGAFLKKKALYVSGGQF